MHLTYYEKSQCQKLRGINQLSVIRHGLLDELILGMNVYYVFHRIDCSERGM